MKTLRSFILFAIWFAGGFFLPAHGQSINAPMAGVVYCPGCIPSYLGGPSQDVDWARSPDLSFMNYENYNDEKSIFADVEAMRLDVKRSHNRLKKIAEAHQQLFAAEAKKLDKKVAANAAAIKDFNVAALKKTASSEVLSVFRNNTATEMLGAQLVSSGQMRPEVFAGIRNQLIAPSNAFAVMAQTFGPYDPASQALMDVATDLGNTAASIVKGFSSGVYNVVKTDAKFIADVVRAAFHPVKTSWAIVDVYRKLVGIDDWELVFLTLGDAAAAKWQKASLAERVDILTQGTGLFVSPLTFVASLKQADRVKDALKGIEGAVVATRGPLAELRTSGELAKAFAELEELGPVAERAAEIAKLTKEETRVFAEKIVKLNPELVPPVSKSETFYRRVFKEIATKKEFNAWKITEFNIKADHRASRIGEGALYMGTTKEVALAEVSFHGQRSLEKFNVLEDTIEYSENFSNLELLDLSSSRAVRETLGINISKLRKIGEYDLMQLVSDVARKRGYKGLIYRSAHTDAGEIVAVFGKQGTTLR